MTAAQRKQIEVTLERATRQFTGRVGLVPLREALDFLGKSFSRSASGSQLRCVASALLALDDAVRLQKHTGYRNALAEAAGIARLLMLEGDGDVPAPKFTTFKRAQDAILARWEELGEVPR
jgi:hypothetical protein